MIHLRLYIAGHTGRSMLAQSNIKKLLSHLSSESYTVETIDLLENSALASKHHIIAIPTTVRTDVAPIKKVIGDLSDLESARIALDIYCS